MMRMILYEAAQTTLMCSAKWSWLKAWAMKVAGHHGMEEGGRAGLSSGGPGRSPLRRSRGSSRPAFAGKLLADVTVPLVPSR